MKDLFEYVLVKDEFGDDEAVAVVELKDIIAGAKVYTFREFWPENFYSVNCVAEEIVEFLALTETNDNFDDAYSLARALYLFPVDEQRLVLDIYRYHKDQWRILDLYADMNRGSSLKAIHPIKSVFDLLPIMDLCDNITLTKLEEYISLYEHYPEYAGYMTLEIFDKCIHHIPKEALPFFLTRELYKQSIYSWEKVLQRKIYDFDCYRLHNKNYIMCEIAMDGGFWQQLDIDYIEESSHVITRDLSDLADMEVGPHNPSLQDFIRAGLKLHTVLPLTKKECARFYEEHKDEPMASLIDQPKTALFKAILFRYPEMPLAWIQYIDTMLQADWAWAKRKQLDKTRTIQGPGGETVTMHYHRLLANVTDDLLVQGAKTAWRRVSSAIEDIEVEKLRAELGECRPLPLLDHPKFDGITPITNSVELMDEGETMHHCVASYLNSCLMGKSYIYHVGPAAPDGTTIEIIFDDKDKPRIAQIYGYDNKRPSKELRNMADEFLTMLIDLKVSPNTN